MKKILALLILLTLVVSVFAACKKDEKPAGDNQPPVTETPSDEQGPTLEDAKVVVRDLYKQIEITPDDFNVVASVLVDGVKFTITWTTDSADVVIAESTKENAYLVDIVPAEPEADIPYVLTATIAAADGSTLTTTFNYKVPKFQVNTYAEYVAAEADAPLVVEGVVYGIMSKAAGDKENSVFVQDPNGGGYYVYALADDPTETGIQVGQTVRVRGVKAIYNGTLEIKNASIEIRSTELTTVTPVDLTAAFTAASTATNANLLAHLGEYVVVKGVTVLEAGSNGYYYFELDGVKTYVRISSSSNCTTSAQESTIIANHTAKFYYTADVAGIASIYQGNFYLMPVDDKAFDNFSAEQQPLPDSVKVNMVKDALTLPEEFVVANPYTLPLAGVGDNFSDVAIAWALAETTNATLAEDVLTPVIPAEGSVNITLTATITKGEASVTKEFTIAVKKLEITSITAALELAAAQAHNTYTADKYMVEGVIAEFKSGGETYGNLWIADAEGNRLYVYGVYTSDGVTKYGDMTGDKPKVGDKVVLYGALGTYNTDQQMKSGWLISWEHVYTKTTTNATCKDDGTNTYTCACGHSYTETIPAGEHDYVEGVCSACGVANHEHTLVAGTVVPNTCTTDGYTTYTCSGCTYTENKDVTTKTGHAYVDGYCTNEGCGVVDPDFYFEKSITDTLAAADNTKVKVTGTVIRIDTDYSSQYNNITLTIKDESGATLYCYRLTGNFAVNDIITVTGVKSSYNGAPQMAQGATAEKIGVHECTNFTEATCKKLAACTLCGKETGELAAHTYVEGTCSVCGHVEGAAEVVTQKATMSYTASSTGNMTGSNDAATLGLDATLFTVIGNKGGTNNNCGLNKAGQIRLYGSSSNGNGSYFTVTVAEGYTIKSIKVNFSNTTNNKNCQLTVNGTSTVFDGSSSAWEVDVNSNSFELKNVITGATTQIYIASIEITYAEA